MVRPNRLAIAMAAALAGGTALAENVTPNLQVNGFATAGGSWVTEDFNTVYLGSPFQPSAGIDENGAFQNDNVLGLQFSYALDERVDLVGQLVSKGRQEYDTEAEWAYIAYRASDRLRLRAGRFALPSYTYSENRNVGQAYPWARLPVEVYGFNPLTSLDGFDALYRLPLGDWNLDGQVNVGGFDNEYANLKNLTGLNVTLSNDSLSLHVGYSTSKLSYTAGKDPFGNDLEQAGYLFDAYGVDLDTHEQEATFADLGIIYDDGSWFLAAELSQLRLDGYLTDQDAGYLSVGHYFGKWLPYVMYSKTNTVNADECVNELSPAVDNAVATATFIGTNLGFGSPQYAAAAQAAQAVGGAAYVTCQGTEQTSYSAGFRYDATKNVSLKLELDHVTDFHDTPGYFSGVVLTDDDSTEVITFNVNAAF